MNTCKTCKHWVMPPANDYDVGQLCRPLDQDTYEPMNIGFEVRQCKMPTQTFAETPTERNGFGLVDASTYYAAMATGEDFGCVRHEQ